MSALDDLLMDAVAGSAPHAVITLNTLGIAFRDAAGNALKADEVRPEILDKIAALKSPALRARVAMTLLGTEATS